MTEGQYYYGRHRRMWGVWQHHGLGDGMARGTFVADFPTKEAAREYVERANERKGE